jgi:Skp family chaperone for outer membrane proteins
LSLLVGTAALGLAVYLGSRLWAQAPAAPVQAPAQTRIAVVNTVQLLTSYYKFKAFQEELNVLAKPYKENVAKLETNKQEWEKVLKNPNAPEKDRQQAEIEIRKRKHEMDDLDAEGKKVIGKRYEDGFVQLYREVEDCIKRYAAANGFHLVLQFSEPPNATDLYTMRNLNRKLEGLTAVGASMPIYTAPGLDITSGVLTNLNANAPRAAAGGAAPAPAPAQGPAGGR